MPKKEQPVTVDIQQMEGVLEALEEKKAPKAMTPAERKAKEKKAAHDSYLKKHAHLRGADLDEIKAVFDCVMERYYELTGRLVVRHIPEAELQKAREDFMKATHPVTISDFHSVQKVSGKTISRFAEDLGITRNRYYEIVSSDEIDPKTGRYVKDEKGDRVKKPTDAVIEEVPVSLALKLYSKLPSAIPVTDPDPIDVHEIVGGEDKINFQILPVILGLDASRARGWKTDVNPSEVTRPLLRLLLESHQAEDILDIMIDNVYEEGKLLGRTPFKNMTWKPQVIVRDGVEIQETPGEEIDRRFLNAPTVDHRRSAARQGKLIGWPTTNDRLQTNMEILRERDKGKSKAGKSKK